MSSIRAAAESTISRGDTQMRQLSQEQETGYRRAGRLRSMTVHDPDQTKLLRGGACGMRATFFGIRGR